MDVDETDSMSGALERYKILPVVETARVLGRGSYADVFVVSHLGLPCAAKRYRLDLGAGKETDKADLDKTLECFEHTCEVLSKLRHPNVVQFMGIYCDPVSVLSLPVLVFEQMSTTLTKCIDKYGVLPNQISHSILKDVAMALCYLHGQSSPIAHKALNANNVLLGRDMLAKLSDIGVSAIVDLHKSYISGEDIPEGPHSSICYLPPEAYSLQCSSELTTGSDIFSYGILVLHVLTGRLPIPDVSVGLGSEGSNTSITEAEFRHEYISELKEEHPLRETVLLCLSNTSVFRPHITTVLQRVIMAAACYKPAYANSVEMLQQLERDADEQLTLRNEISKLSPQSSIDLFQNSSEMERLRQSVATLTAKNRALQEILSAKTSGKNGTTVNDPDKVTITRRIQRSSRMQTPITYSPHELQQRRIKWTRCTDLPVAMFQAQSVVIGNKVYVGGGNTGDTGADSLVFEYSHTEDRWNQLPPTPVTLFGLGQLLGELVIIGGKFQQNVYDCVYVFDRFTRRWKDSLPALIKARYVPTCISLQFGLLVCGGFSDSHKVLSSIEMIDCDNFEWQVAGYLSRPATLCYTSAVAVKESLFFLGGYQSSTASSVTNVAHKTSLDNLTSPAGISPYAWKCLPPTPHIQSTAGTLGNCIIAVGGSSTPYMLPVHNSIYTYSPSSDAWIKVGSLPYAACHVTVTTLPSNDLLVLGGWVRPGEFKRSYSVYRGSMSV